MKRIQICIEDDRGNLKQVVAGRVPDTEEGRFLLRVFRLEDEDPIAAIAMFAMVGFEAQRRLQKEEVA